MHKSLLQKRHAMGAVVSLMSGEVVGESRGEVASPLQMTMTPGGHHVYYCLLLRVHCNRHRPLVSWEMAATGL